MESMYDLIMDELRAKLHDDACHPEDVDALQQRFEVMCAETDTATLRSFYDEVRALGPRGEQPDQPSDLDGIRAARGEGPRRMRVDLSHETLFDKVLGGLLGRASGCALGKPVEGWTRYEIEAYLEALGEGDVSDYIPYVERLPEGAPRSIHHWLRNSCRGNIEFMPRDDDMDYTLLGLHVLRSSGTDFTTRDVANAWLNMLPYHCTYTAERVAYRNLVNGMHPPRTATHWNPYREWIGAQIRADGFGYACPGVPRAGSRVCLA